MKCYLFAIYRRLRAAWIRFWTSRSLSRPHRLRKSFRSRANRRRAPTLRRTVLTRLPQRRWTRSSSFLLLGISSSASSFFFCPEIRETQAYKNLLWFCEDPFSFVPFFRRFVIITRWTRNVVGVSLSDRIFFVVYKVIQFLSSLHFPLYWSEHPPLADALVNKCLLMKRKKNTFSFFLPPLSYRIPPSWRVFFSSDRVVSVHAKSNLPNPHYKNKQNMIIKENKRSLVPHYRLVLNSNTFY